MHLPQVSITPMDQALAQVMVWIHDATDYRNKLRQWSVLSIPNKSPVRNEGNFGKYGNI